MMNKIHVLDCTLRDGGYCNQWKFGYEHINKIINSLIEANIDIIECGFLTEKTIYDPDVTKFTNLEQIKKIIPQYHEKKIFVAMLNYGEFNIQNLPENDGTSINGIRVAFHKKDLEKSLFLCEKIKEKGYLVFVQAMVSLSYTDEEFLNMIQKVNKLEPYAFYIVDSFGMMKRKDLTRLFYMVEHNLNKSIYIGFHSHNNMQLAYSNAQSLVDTHTESNLIIDSSVYGMGRGAGNLNTELFVEYLNENAGANYSLTPLLTIIDEILNEFYQQNYWGYSLPNYLSAMYNLHPDYARYLDDKKTLTVESINKIFDTMDKEKKFSYDKVYIEDIYQKYMTAGKVQEEHKSELKNILKHKKVLLIAPGKSSYDEQSKIIKFSKDNNIITIGVNFEYPVISSDYIFLSNLRRYRELKMQNKNNCIVTSNIPDENVYLQIKYHELINKEEAVKDNAGMMAIKFLIMYEVKEIYLAGFDGYSHDVNENYGDTNMAFTTKNIILDAMNKGMCNVLKEFSKKTKIKFLTTPKYIFF